MSPVRLFVFVCILFASAACSSVPLEIAMLPTRVPKLSMVSTSQPTSALPQPTMTISPVFTPVLPTPTIWPTPIENPGALLDYEYSPDYEDFPTIWIRETNPYGGYSFEIPERWRAGFRPNGYSGLVPPIHGKTDLVTIEYLTFEKPIEDDLVEWLYRWKDIVGQIHPMLRRGEFETVEFGQQRNDDSQQAYEYFEDLPIGQGYILTNGRMVLRLTTEGASGRQDAIFRHIAESVEFLGKAPTTVHQIYDLDQVHLSGNQPEYVVRALTLDDFEHRQQVNRTAWNAYNTRLETGSAPKELLVDAEIADRYIELMEEGSFRVAEADLERASQPRSPLATPTAIAQSPLVSERPRSHPTLTATPTSTPYPPTVLDDLAEDHPGLTPLVNECPYNERDCLMAFWYDDMLWEGVEGATYNYLRHRALDKCGLWFTQPHGGGTQISSQILGGSKWEVILSVSGRIIYSGGADGHGVLVVAGLPNAVDYRENEEDKGQCQIDIEDVLKTISVVSLKP